MAFIPDEAIDRMTELSAGAWRLYCYLARCRNQKTGKCCPSVRTTAEAVDTHPKNVFRLRSELAAAGWATFSADDAVALLGFESSKNATPAKPAVAKTLPAVAKTLPNGSKNATAYKEEPAKEPANRTSKDKARRAVPPAVAFVRYLTHRFPDKTLWPRITATLGENFDEGRLTKCYEDWVSHGWNKMNLVWVFEWYTQGIPERSNGNGQARKPYETHNERVGRQMEELARRTADVYAAPAGDSGPDTTDAGWPWPAIDVAGVRIE